MKVKIKDLEPNPFRDMDNYPINEEKVKTLMDSYEQTGFWRNINARPSLKAKGKFELAFGHHRWIALSRIYEADHIIDIVIDNYSDATMLKMMASENMMEYKTDIKTIDETVRQTLQFLENHPEEVPFQKGTPRWSREANKIAEFLRWKEQTVYYSLERIGLIKDKVIEKEVIESLPDTASRHFIAAVKKHEIPKYKQEKAAKKIIEKQSFGKDDIEDILISEKYKKEPKKIAEIEHERLKKYEDEISKATNMADDFSEQLIILLKFKEDFNSEYYRGTYARRRFLMSVEKIQKQFELLILNKNENENESSISSKGLLGIGN